MACYCRYGFSVTKRLVWSTLNSLFTCIFDIGRVKFNIFGVGVFAVHPGHSYSQTGLSNSKNVFLMHPHVYYTHEGL